MRLLGSERVDVGQVGRRQPVQSEQIPKGSHADSRSDILEKVAPALNCVELLQCHRITPA